MFYKVTSFSLFSYKLIDNRAKFKLLFHKFARVSTREINGYAIILATEKIIRQQIIC